MKKLILFMYIFIFVGLQQGYASYIGVEEKNGFTFTFTENNLKIENQSCVSNKITNTGYGVNKFVVYYDNIQHNRLEFIIVNKTNYITKGFIDSSCFFNLDEYELSNTPMYYYSINNNFCIGTNQNHYYKLDPVNGYTYYDTTPCSITNSLLITQNFYFENYIKYGLLEITNTGTITSIQNGIEITGLQTNKDFSLEYKIFEWDGTAEYQVDSGNLGSFSGGTNNIDINYNFRALQDYDLEIKLTSLIDQNDVVIQYYGFNYEYNSGYIPPEDIDFNFFVSGYNFFENGFALLNFVPEPGGGALYFEILQPSGSGTTAVETQKYYPFEIDGNGYGLDSAVKVTYPYHPVQGTYQVRLVYEYNGLKIYPFGEDYNSYVISLAEIENDIPPEFTQLTWGETITSYYMGIKGFFRELMKIGKTEPKEWGFNFIETTNASNERIVFNFDENDESILGDLYGFLYGFVIMCFLILALIIYLILLKK